MKKWKTQRNEKIKNTFKKIEFGLCSGVFENGPQGARKRHGTKHMAHGVTVNTGKILY